MSLLKLMLRDNRTSFRPGEPIEGAAGWQLETPPRSVEVRLFWYTRGKGSEDVDVIAKISFENPKVEEARPFRFIAPTEPFSFSGKLITLTWAVEVVVEPAGNVERIDLVISPTGKEIVLHK